MTSPVPADDWQTTDQLNRAIAAYLTRITGASRDHACSDLLPFLVRRAAPASADGTPAAFDVGGVLTQVGQLHDVRDRWQERLGMTAAEFTKALAGVDPEELAFTGLLTEAQYTAGLARALGQPIARADEFMADMCGELDAELFADVASLRPRYATAILSDAIGVARREYQA